MSSLIQTISKSFSSSIGKIVFGMEDGTVSIFGLVFGVAASAHSSSALVLLAGATGACAAAVAMMAGTYLEVESVRGKAQGELALKQAEIQQHPEEEEKRIAYRLHTAGFNDQGVTAILHALRSSPDAMLRVSGAFELHSEQQNPLIPALWMFVSDLFAGFVPVIPFAFFSLETARIVSLAITALLLSLLGVGRGLVARRNLVLTALETLGIATAAALAGVLIGKLVTV